MFVIGIAKASSTSIAFGTFATSAARQTALKPQPCLHHDWSNSHADAGTSDTLPSALNIPN